MFSHQSIHCSLLVSSYWSIFSLLLISINYLLVYSANLIAEATCIFIMRDPDVPALSGRWLFHPQGPVLGSYMRALSTHSFLPDLSSVWLLSLVGQELNNLRQHWENGFKKKTTLYLCCLKEVIIGCTDLLHGLPPQCSDCHCCTLGSLTNFFTACLKKDLKM